MGIGGVYRYGFNGKENDNEIKGEGNQQDYGMRIYDPRIGKFLSVGPLSKKYPELTPYQFASNTPIWAIDIDGAEGGIPISYGSGSQSTNEIAGNYHIGKEVRNWWNAPANPGQAYSWNLAANLPKGTVKTNGGVIAAMAIYMGNNYMNRVGNSKIVAKVNASNLAPQAPRASVAVKTSQPVIETPSANEVQSTTNSLPEHVYRFDTRSPEEIKAAGGFQSWGTNMNLSEHIDGSSVRNKTSGYIGTTKSTGVVDIWLDGYESGYIYEIKTPSNAVEVNKHAPPNYGFSWEQEFAIPLKIPYKNIVDYQSLSLPPSK